MTLLTLARAARLAEALANIRQSLEYLREDRSNYHTVKVDGLTRTYGSDRQSIAFQLSKPDLFEVLEGEERRLTGELTALGIDPTAVPR